MSRRAESRDPETRIRFFEEREFVNCGPRAVYGRSVVGEYRIWARDQVVLEFA